MTPIPHTRTVDVVDNYHGWLVPDPYRWLEDQDSAEVRQWAENQVERTRTYLDALPGRQVFADRLAELSRCERRSVPKFAGGYQFDCRNDGGQEQDCLWVTDPEGTERLAFDPLTLDAGTALVAYFPTQAGDRIALCLTQGGGDWMRVRVLDLPSGKLTDDVVSWVRFPCIAWLADAGFYYAGFDPLPPGAEHTAIPTGQRLRLHRMGDPPGDDEDVLPMPDGFSFLDVSASDDGRWLIVHSLRATTPNRVQIRPIAGGTWITVADGNDLNRVAGIENDTVVVHTTEGTPGGRIVAYEIVDDRLSAPRIVVPEASQPMPSAFAQSAFLARDHVVTVHHDVTESIVRVTRLAGGDSRQVRLPWSGTVGAEASASSQRDHAYLTLIGWTNPPAILDLDVASTEASIWFAPQLPGHDQSRYLTERTLATSTDGVQVPFTIVRRADLPPDQARPTLVTGYGGFGINFSALGFQTWYLPWLESGGVLAACALRGGDELGEAWHQAGTRHDKQNVFDDLIACTEKLISDGWTARAHIAVNGTSNGGLLAAAVLTQRPDLFAAAVPEVGVLDMLRYHHFTGGPAWIEEYGYAQAAEDFPVLYAYSPIHNVVTGRAYPATLIVTGEHDTRVPPGVHSFKFAATLQAAQRGSAPILLRVARNSGHGHSKRRSDEIAERADILAFTASNTGLNTTASQPADAPPRQQGKRPISDGAP